MTAAQTYWAELRNRFAAVPPKTKIFYFLLCSPTLLWALIVIPGWIFDGSNFSKAVTFVLVFVSPIVAGDISIFGQITPVILAGAIISLLPITNEINIPAIALAIIVYGLYVHLSYFYEHDAGDTYIQLLWHTDQQKTDALKTLQSFIANIRTVALVVVATIIGIPLRKGS